MHRVNLYNSQNVNLTTSERLTIAMQNIEMFEKILADSNYDVIKKILDIFKDSYDKKAFLSSLFRYGSAINQITEADAIITRLQLVITLNPLEEEVTKMDEGNM